MRDAITCNQMPLSHTAGHLMREATACQSKASRHLVENWRLLEPSPAHEELGIELLWEVEVEAFGAVPDGAR